MPRKKKKPELPKYVVVKFNSWYVRRTWPTKETYETGKLKRLEITRRCIPETEERASELSKQIEAALFAEKIDQAKTPTVGEYVTKYLETKKRSVTRRTYEDYMALTARYIDNSAFSRIAMPDVKAKDVQTFINILEKRGISPVMIRKVFIVVSMTFRQAVLWEDLVKNPATGTLLPTVSKEEAAAFTKKEAKRLIPIFRKDPDCLIFEFDLETGMRPQELLALSWSKLDFENKRAKIDRALSDGLQGGGFEIKEPKTKASIRSVSFSSYMRGRLLEHRDRQLAFLKALKKQIALPLTVAPEFKKGVNYEKRKVIRRHRQQVLANFLKYDLVFPASNGLPQKRNNLNRREFKRALELAGLDSGKFSFKSLRHTNASIMAEKVSPKRLQRHLGHSSAIVSLQYYVHVDEDSQDEFSDKFVEELY